MAEDSVATLTNQDMADAQRESARRMLQIGVQPSICTFDPSTEEGKILLFRVKYGEPQELAEQGGRILLVRHYYAHEVTGQPNDDGEIKDYVRSVIVTAEGEIYSAGSMGVWDCLRLMSAIRGPGVFDPPVPCMVKKKKTNNGRNFMQLVPEESALLKRK